EIAKVRIAVRCKRITEEQYKIITGETYQA
ncbi:XkdX family protein, partial [Listeria monocytogenes]|nr:XkdX family protein [Listeria monocytogenes]